MFVNLYINIDRGTLIEGMESIDCIKRRQIIEV